MQLLREAAALMRKRAEAAKPGRWDSVHGGVISWRDPDSPEVVVPTEGRYGQSIAAADAAHIASWHPAVALAVADWLDAEAANRDAGIGGRGWDSIGGRSDADAVANAYLGTTGA